MNFGPLAMPGRANKDCARDRRAGGRILNSEQKDVEEVEIERLIRYQ